MSELTAHLSQIEIEPIEVVPSFKRKELSLEELMADGIENGPDTDVQGYVCFACECDCGGCCS